MKNPIVVVLVLTLTTSSILKAQKLEQYRYLGSKELPENTNVDKIRFNGYTNYWYDSYKEWHRYGNLFKMEIPDVPASIAQNKVDIAEELGITGLAMQEGFISNLFEGPYKVLWQPSIDALEERYSEGNLLVFTEPDSPVGKKLLSLAGRVNSWINELSSHQFEALNFSPVDAFYLEYGNKYIFVVISSEQNKLELFNKLIENTDEVLTAYDLHRGWMGAQTTYKSVGIDFGHPLDLIGKGMNEGNSWFVFSGYNDYMTKDELTAWMEEVGNPVFADVGSTTLSYISGASCFLYGCNDYKGLQEQDITLKAYLQFVKEKKGQVFRQVYDTVADQHKFDGFVALEGNKEQVDNEEVPFVHLTGTLDGGAASSMVLFIKKGTFLTRNSLMSAILDRKAVAVLPEGKMMGPGYYRNVLQLLLLDRTYLEEYFGDHIDMKVETDGYDLHLTLTNHKNRDITGDLKIVLPRNLESYGTELTGVMLPAQSEKMMHFPIKVNKLAMGKTNPIAINFEWEGNKKATVTKLDLPPAVSAHRLLYGQAPIVTYPVSVHNYSGMSSFPLKVQVTEMKNPGKIIFEEERICSIPSGSYDEMFLDLELPAGDYMVSATALDSEASTQLGVEHPQGNPKVQSIDLNADGVMEYRMENDSVQVTLLSTGARVIEYIVKSKNDNVFFKLWPEKPINHRSPFRKRKFYPYGGFEDFLGGASMESHKVYDAEVIQSEGGRVSVRMRAEFYGNTLEKVFTLYGNSPLLEVKYNLDFSYPEASIIGPQPILKIGKEHGPEDVFVIPDQNGIEKYRMKKEVYYGRMFNMKEGWNAGYDTKENIGFVGAFPVDQPEFMHMYMNHPRNPASHYYYVEFQPWIHIIRKNKMYFSYYMWASADRWDTGVEALRKRNLITKQ